jgi:hypothetical protein
MPPFEPRPLALPRPSIALRTSSDLELIEWTLHHKPGAIHHMRPIAGRGSDLGVLGVCRFESHSSSDGPFD